MSLPRQYLCVLQVLSERETCGQAQRMRKLPGRIALGVLGALSAALGAILIAVGVVSRHDRTMAAGKRRFHGRGLDRRWIADPDERERHDSIVAERLDLDMREPGEVGLAEAAERLGVSVGTIRRRAKRGQLKAAHRNGRLTGVILEAE